MEKNRKEKQADNALLKKTRYIWLKNHYRLIKKRKKKLVTLKYLNLRTSRVYNIEVILQSFWSIEDKGAAIQYLKKGYYWATHSRMETTERDIPGHCNLLQQFLTGPCITEQQ